MMSDPVRDVRLEIPVTLRDERVPMLVMFGCAAVRSVPVIDVRFAIAEQFIVVTDKNGITKVS